MLFRSIPCSIEWLPERNIPIRCCIIPLPKFDRMKPLMSRNAPFSLAPSPIADTGLHHRHRYVSRPLVAPSSEDNAYVRKDNAFQLKSFVFNIVFLAQNVDLAYSCSKSQRVGNLVTWIMFTCYIEPICMHIYRRYMLPRVKFYLDLVN